MGITKLRADAIVNAANEGLWPGGGVCGAIHAAAGSRLADECARIGLPPIRCPTGETVITNGCNLPADFVLHTVGPQGSNCEQLRCSYKSALDLAAEKGLQSVGFCCVSTGIYGFPLKLATHVALRTVREWLDTHAGVLQRVVFVVFGPTEEEAYDLLLPCYFPRADEPEHDKTRLPCHQPQKAVLRSSSASSRQHRQPSSVISHQPRSASPAGRHRPTTSRRTEEQRCASM